MKYNLFLFFLTYPTKKKKKTKTKTQKQKQNKQTNKQTKKKKQANSLLGISLSVKYIYKNKDTYWTKMEKNGELWIRPIKKNVFYLIKS